MVVSDRRWCAARVEQLLEIERFQVVVCASSAAALERSVAVAPTVVVLDWSLDDEPGREELIYRLRPRRSGPRVVVVAEPAQHASLLAMSGVSGVLAPTLEAEEVVDAVWRLHHEVAEARAGK
jgi:DNA-binding response OmpR family regulator